MQYRIHINTTNLKQHNKSQTKQYALSKIVTCDDVINMASMHVTM
jgi:hypothetical protein